MATELKELLAGMRVSDENGRATLELVEIIQRIVDRSREQDVTLDDHETRITTLEP